MEHIYPNIPSSRRFQIKKEMLRFQRVLSHEVFPKTEEELITEMGFEGTDDEDFIELKKEVDLMRIFNYDDVRVTEFIPGEIRTNHLPLYKMPSPGNNLNTFKKFHELRTAKKSLFLQSELNNRAVTYKALLKYNEERDLAPIKEARFTIRCYKPLRYSHTSYQRKPKFEEEFQCLSSQYLTELRDKLFCKSNYFNCFETSDKPLQHNPTRETDPGTFFITDTFYNDTRNELNPDYSENILKWMENQSDFDVSKYKKDKMETTKFSDLTFRLGFPQVYMHYGNCEHLFIISQVELLSTVSDEERALYPSLRSLGPDLVQMCDICGRREREYMLKNSGRQVFRHTFVCKRCLIRYNYADNQKLEDFQLYRINPNAIIPIDPNDPKNANIKYPELTQENARFFINEHFKEVDTETDIDVYNEKQNAQLIATFERRKLADEKETSSKNTKRKKLFTDMPSIGDDDIFGPDKNIKKKRDNTNDEMDNMEHEDVDNDLNVDEDVDNEFGFDEDVNNDPDVNEDVDNEFGFDEDVNNDPDVNEDVNNEFGFDEDVDNEFGFDKDVDNEFGFDEDVDNEFGFDEDVNNDPDIDDCPDTFIIKYIDNESDNDNVDNGVNETDIKIEKSATSTDFNQNQTDSIDEKIEQDITLLLGKD